MKFSGKYKMLPLAALVLATSGLSAQASEAWVSTATKAPRVPANSTHLAAMTAGSPTHVVVSLKVSDQAGLTALTDKIMTGRARPISSADFLAKFAPTA